MAPGPRVGFSRGNGKTSWGAFCLGVARPFFLGGDPTMVIFLVVSLQSKRGIPSKSDTPSEKGDHVAFPLNRGFMHIYKIV